MELFVVVVYIALLNSFSFGDDAVATSTQSSSEPTDAPENCGHYRAIARLPNPLRVRGEICCDNLGCFSNQKGTPWEHMAELPECIIDMKPQFHLFTPEQDSTAQVFDYYTLNDTVDKLVMNANRQFVAVIHGFNTKWPSEFMFAMKKELIKLGNNVLLVQWTEGSNKKDYIKSAANTRTVGKAVGVIIQTLVDHNKVTLDKSTIIGFSLGAHTAGYAGTHLKNLRRIIGLDPAGPLFVCEDVQARLDSRDAKFVQIIHTNGKSFLSGGLGTLEPLGHVDFYANGGVVQPGCSSSSPFISFATFDFSKVGESVSCSHKRCPWLFIDMLRYKNSPSNSCSFTSFPCEDKSKWKDGQCFSCPANGCPAPGYDLDFGTPYRGKFFFNTLPDNSTDGYCGK